MTERDDLDRLAERVETDPQARETYEDAAARERLIDEFVAARGDTPQRVVASRMRTTQSAVSDLELGRVDPRLSTLQRYARAVGSRLRVGLDGSEVAGATEQVAHDTLRLGDDLTIASMLADLLKPRRQAGSSAELAERIGLPPHTVGRMAERLHEAGWLAMDHQRRILLNHDRGAVIGVSLTRGRAQAVLTSLRPDDVHARAEHPLDDGSPVEVIRTIERLVDGLRSEVPSGAQLVGIGVALAGLVDGRTGSVHFAPDLEPTTPRSAGVPARSLWDGTPLADDISFATGLRTAVENDANALAFYEYLVRPDDDDDLAVILLSESGDGVGAGLVVNGAIVHGAGGVSAEIGHVVVDDEGTTCRCGRARGCLETVASPNAIVTRVVGARTDAPDLRWVARLAAEGDPDALRELRYAGVSLGRVVAHLTAIIGPPRVVLFGPAELVEHERFASAEVFVSGIQQSTLITPFRKAPAFEVRVLRSYAEAEAASAAAASVLQHFAAKPREWVPGLLPDAERAA